MKISKKFGRVGVLMGGYSSERGISLKSGKAIYDSLFQQGYHVVGIDIKSHDEHKITSQILDFSIDLAFIALHGQLGEDGLIQSILERMQIPYTGSGVKASQLAYDKVLSHEQFKKDGLVIPPHKVLMRECLSHIDEASEGIDFLPVVVKPACEGSSIGISIVEKRSELVSALLNAFKYGGHVLVESYIKGRELTVGILDDRPLDIIEIISKKDFFDFSAKYDEGLTAYIVPAQLPQQVSDQIKSVAQKAHTILGCSVFSRIDFILDETMVPFILEVNTIPGFTDTSLLPKAAKHAGINFHQLCSKILEITHGQKEKIKDPSIKY